MSRRRLLAGLAVALGGTGLLCAIAPLTSLQGKQLVGAPFLLVVLGATLVGGLVPALVASAASFVALRYFYVEPIHTFRVSGGDAAGLVAWLATAVLLAWALDRERRSLTKLRTGRKATALALERGDVGAWELTPSSETLWLSKDAERLLGIPEGASDGAIDTILARVDPDDVGATRAAIARIASGALEVALDFRVTRPDGQKRTLELRGGAVAAAEAGSGGLAGIVSDVTERVAREEQLAFLAEVSTTLASSLEMQETLDRVASVVVPHIADWCAIQLVSDADIETVAIHHLDPAKTALAWELMQQHPYDPDAQSGTANVIRTGRSELYSYISDELLASRARDERELEVIRRLDLSCAIVVPLIAHDAVLGAMTLIGEGGRRFGAQELALAEEVARRAAVAVENARLYEAQSRALGDAEQARARMARLQAVTDALSETMTRAEVAHVLMREGLLALQAQAGAVFQLAGGGRSFETVDSTGYVDGFDATLAGPVAEAIETRAVVSASSPEEFDARWPHRADAPGSSDRATITAPLLVGDEPIGALHLGFRTPRAFDETDRSLASTLARQCALALERARLFEGEQIARSQAERLAARLRRLQKVVDSTFMSGDLDAVLEEMLLRLREAVGGDTAAVLIVNDAGEALVARKAVGFNRDLDTYVPIGEGFAGRIAATQTHHVIRDISKARVISTYFAENGIVSLAGVPLIADGRLIGVVHVGSKEEREFDREDILLLRLVAARAAVAIDRARTHEREHRIAEVLQRSLLPERLPAIDGLEIAARYVPGTVGVAVGGDWYDVFELTDGSVGVVVGDVVGHGVRAAAAMGRLRNVLRAFALEGLGPGETLTRLNRIACEPDSEIFATAFYALLAPSHTRLRVANAGHPPPVLRCADGTIQLIESARSLPLGASADAPYEEVDLSLGPGSSLVLYTDGLVERRGESIDVGIGRLVEVVSRSDAPVDLLADRILDAVESTDHTDDLALVVVRVEPVVEPTFRLRFPAEPKALAPTRAALRSWLVSQGAGDDEIFEILVAVNEACSNAVEHPLDPAGGEVQIEASIVDGEVSIEIRDSGRWRPVRPRPDRGRGIDFMHALMEDVEIVSSDEGTSVRMERRLRR